MMLKTYPALFHQDETGYWVEFPEFNGGTQGDTLDEAMSEAKDFLASVLAWYIDDNEPLPTSSDITQLKIDDGFVTMIQADPTPYIRGNKAVRKNVTVPEWLVIRAEKEKVNFSETLTEALKHKLHLS